MGVSLQDLDASKAGETPFEFEYINQAGNKTGIFFSVLGGQSEKVSKEIARLINERRHKEAVRETFRKGNPNKVEFEPLEDDVEFGQRLAAVRLAGWRGIDDPFSAENALRLCKGNREIAAQVTAQSDAVGNFIQL